jgi:hypothetical protein
LYGTVVKSLSETHPDLGFASEPVEVQRYDDGSVQPVGGDVVVVVVVGGRDVDVGGWDVDVVGGRLVDVVLVCVTLPVHVVPLSAKLVGTGFAELFHDPLKPKLALPPVGMLPL